jgi:hypothetical protein
MRNTSKKFKQLLRGLLVAFFRLIGSDIVDCRTGRKLGRGLVFCWRGHVLLLGCDCAVVPVPLPQKRLTYWNQMVGFTAHPEPDFPRSRPLPEGGTGGAQGAKVLLVLLDHRGPGEVQRTLALWSKAGFGADSVLLTYGGPEGGFGGIGHANKILLGGRGHRTADHQRDRQSYREIFSKAAAWADGRGFTHILFHEYDHVPLVADLAARLPECLREEGADVLCCHLGRVDGSNHPHWLDCMGEDPAGGPVLSMLGTGHFWTLEAWNATAADQSLAHWYLELDLPTTALRNGFRIRQLAAQNPFVKALEHDRPDPAAAAGRGAWTLHPVKKRSTLLEVGAILDRIVSSKEA